MTERPQPPTEDDLPEELSILEVPAEARSSKGNRSRGLLGIVIAALLGSITAIGLFVVIKPYLVATKPSSEEKKTDDVSLNSWDTSPASESEHPAQRETPRQISVDRSSNVGQRENTVARDPSVAEQKPPVESTLPEVGTSRPEQGGAPFAGPRTTPNRSGSNPNPTPGVAARTTDHSSATLPDQTQKSAALYPKPDEQEINQANQEIDAVFLPQIRAAKTQEDKVLLVNVLKKAAQDEHAGSATRFVLLERAIDLAIQAPDPLLMIDVIASLVGEFNVDSYEYNLRAVDEWDRMKAPDKDPATEQEYHRGLARMAATLGDTAYQRKDFKTAAAMYAIASKHRDRAGDKEIAGLFGKKRTAARTKEARYSLTASLLEDLKTTPEDAGQQLEAGIACMQTGLWDEGLNCLLQGSDESLKIFAREQLNLRANRETRLEAGDQSWDAVRTLDRRHSVWLKELAVADYETVFTEMSRLQTQKVKLRVAQVGPVSCVLPVRIQHFSFESDDFANISNIMVLQNRMGYFGNGRLYGHQNLEAGISGTALELDGRETMVICPESENLIHGDSPFTISIWIHTDEPQNTVLSGRMYQSSSRVQPDFDMRLLADNHVQANLMPANGQPISLKSRDSVPLRQWVQLVMTWDLETLKLYLDGRETASLTVTAPPPQRVLANRAWIAIGGESPAGFSRSRSANSRFTGRVDEFRVYDQALSPLQVFHVYLEDQTAQN